MSLQPAIDPMDAAAVTRDWPCSKPLPKVLSDADLMAVLHLGHTTYCRRKKAGEFAFLEMQPQLPNSHTAYSGVLVDRWVNGELRDNVRARHFFGKARVGR